MCEVYNPLILSPHYEGGGRVSFHWASDTTLHVTRQVQPHGHVEYTRQVWKEKCYDMLVHSSRTVGLLVIYDVPSEVQPQWHTQNSRKVCIEKVETFISYGKTCSTKVNTGKWVSLCVTLR